ncbi:anonymous antigen-1, putative [Babesia ovata]|uniref:Anonymous antigen-1, putative n=1 Tax=Babesia ovata TaxID=189622 RepID=A0A2H6KGI3_9APIC|nr:anonymous antigen-1, putative [Babesia ovata]GBE62094.1 anonymous antigen-1, putative [Babesia ovata]
MAGSRMRRTADSGVAQAVASVKQHQKFKKMLMFSMRSLSDFCNPQLQIHVDNALDALNRNVLPSLVTALSNFGDDEDIIFSCSQILQAMARACMEESDNPEISQKFMKEGGMTAIELILNQCPQDDIVLGYCYAVIECFSASKCLADGGAALTGTICKSVRNKESMPVSVATRALVCLSAICSSSSGPAKMKQHDGMAVLLQLCLLLPAEQPSITTVERAMKAATAVAAAKMIDQASLDPVIQVIEKFKTSKIVLSHGSDIVKSLVSTASLKQSLQDIQKCAAGSPEHKAAVDTLRSLSYISSVGEQLAKDGALGLMVDLIKNAISQMETHKEVMVNVIAVAARILGSVATNRSYCEEVVKKGGVDNLVAAMQVCMDDPPCIASIADALAQLLQAGPDAFLKTDAVAVALPILYQLSDKEDVASSMMAFIAAASQQNELQPAFLSNKVVEIMCTCCQYHFENLPLHLNIIQVLNRFSSQVKDLSLVYEYGGLQGIATSMGAHYRSDKYCLEVLALLLTFACTPDAHQYMTAGEESIIDIILQLMLEHQEIEAITSSAVKVLEILSTEEDVKRTMKGLSLSLQTAKDNPDAAYSKIAAVTGLSRIARLRPIILSSGMPKEIMKSVSVWVEGSIFDGRSKLTKAAMQSAVVASEDAAECVAMIQMVCDLACLAHVKRVIDLEGADDNFLLHCTGALRQMCSVERTYSPEECTSIVESINRVMRKHVDIKNAETQCVEALHDFVQVMGKDGIDALLSTGAIVGVVGYLIKIPMYLPCQIAGVGFLLACAKMDYRALECLKQCNCYQLLRALNRTHKKSRKLKGMVGVLMTMIMPPEAFEAELTQLLVDMTKGTEANDIVAVHTALTSINQLLVAKECVRIAARLGVPETVTKACMWTLKNKALADKVQIVEPGDLAGKDLVDGILFEVAQANFNMAQNRNGLVALTKYQAHLTSLTVFQNMDSPVTTMVEDGACSALDGMTLLFLHNRANVEEALKNDVLAKVCRGFTLFQGCPNVIRSICRCLASMCITEARVKSLIESPDFVKLTQNLVNLVNNDNNEVALGALKAVSELLKVNSELMLNYFATKTDIIPVLFHKIEVHPEDSKIVALSATCLNYFGKNVGNGRKDIPAVLANITRALKENKNVGTTVLPILKLLLNLANQDTKQALKSSGVMEIVSDVMMIHIDDEEIAAAGGELFGFLGAEAQIRALMRAVIDTVKLQQDDMAQQVDSMCIRLAMYLLSPLENRADALADTEEFLGSLNTCIAYAADNKNLVANATLVSRRLCDSVIEDFEDQFGAWAVANSSNLQQIISVLNSEYGASNVKFLCHAYRVFTCCAVNPYVTDLMQAECETVLPRSIELLDRYQGNAEVCHAILEFLNHLAKSPATENSAEHSGSQLIYSVCQQNNADIISIATNLMINHKNADNVVIPAMQLIGELIGGGSYQADKAVVGAAMSAAERVCLGDVSHQRKLAYMEMVARVMGALDTKDAHRLMENVVQMLNAGVIERNPDTLAAYARLLAGAVLADPENKDHMQQLHKMGAIKMLAELLDDRSLFDKATVMTVLQSLRSCVNGAPASAVMVLKEALPKLIENGSDLLTNDPECSTAFCDLLLDAVQIEGVGRVLGNIEPVMNQLHNLQMKAKDVGNKELETRVLQILKGIAADQPKVRNCKSIYLMLEERRSEGQTISISQAMELADDANFLMKTMATYNNKVLVYEEDDGKDFIYGSMALELLYSVEDNCQYLIDSGVLETQMDSLVKQTHLNISNSISAALCAGCLYPVFVAKILTRPDSVRQIGDYLKRIYTCKGMIVPPTAEGSDNIAEVVLINALLLVERSAVNRRIFLKSDVINTVVGIWDSYDQQKYETARLLRQTFRTLRKIVAEGHLDIMLKCNMVARIKQLLAKSDDVNLIPDALFLVGSMAVVKQIKTQICELGLLDGIVQLMERHVGNPNSPNAIITNTCLALANACIGHRQATDRFLQLKGPELNVRILCEYSESHEITNGASILLCNMLYKNDNLKGMYGKLGAPEALVRCLRAYAGSNQGFAIRCIESLFKAISNLALYASNVALFLSAGIEDSFRAWLADLDPSFSDVQLKIGLQTLSNLVMDNKEENMRKFSVVLPPVLKVLAQDRQDSKVALLLFDILASLCRLPDNSKTFLESGGAELCIQTMRRVSYDLVTLTLGINLLATQASTPAGVQKLLELDVFSLLVANLTFEEHTPEMNDILIATLRCLRKLVNSPEMVYLFCSQDGLAATMAVSRKTQQHPVILIESLRLILGMLHLTETKEEGAAPAWENIGMEKDDIDSLLGIVCVCGTNEQAQKMARLQKILFSVIGYFLSQGLGNEALIVNNFSAIGYTYLNNFPSALDVITLMTVLLENVFTAPVEVRNNLLSREIVKKYRDVVSALPKKKPEEKTFYTRCQTLVTALASNEERTLESTGHFDFSLSEWNVDPYPHGIHDLPEPVKQALRAGGRVKGYIRDSTTRDLNYLEWGPEEEEYPYRIAVRCIRNIARGLRHPTLEAANAKEPRKVNNNNCFCILGSATEDFPDGFALPVKCKSVKERDAIVELLVQWRDAATYNY